MATACRFAASESAPTRLEFVRAAYETHVVISPAGVDRRRCAEFNATLASRTGNAFAVTSASSVVVQDGVFAAGEYFLRCEPGVRVRLGEARDPSDS